jgi:hypothetical protein
MNPRKGAFQQGQNFVHGANVKPDHSQTHKPSAVQPKMATSPQLKHPVAPPAYRPQPPPRVLQLKTINGPQMNRLPPVAPPVYRPQSTQAVQPKITKTAPHRQTPAAPAPYHPQPVPKVLQTKMASGQQSHPSLLHRQHVSTPVNRPEQRNAIQPKGILQPRKPPAAPPVYRPDQKRIVQPKLVAEAHGAIQQNIPAQQRGISVAGMPIKVSSHIRQTAIQLVERYLPKGTKPLVATWKFLKTTDDGKYDVYDDGTKSTPINDLAMTRDALIMVPDGADMSDLEESDTEIDYAGTEKKPITKVYRINNLRDSKKMIDKVLKVEPTENFGARIGSGGGVFRIEGKTTQVFIKPVTKEKLVQEDKTQATGFKPEKVTTDKEAKGKAGAYGALFSPLKGKGVEVGNAIYNKFIAKPSVAYPTMFSSYECYLMDEAFVVLSIAEGFRANYSLTLFVASVRALINGETPKQIFYQGTGQIEALHPGASSHSDSGVSGQLMEQNLGLGRNAPHPTTKSMNIKDTDFDDGAKRAKTLFDKSITGKINYFEMLATHMGPVFEVGPKVITPHVETERNIPYSGAKMSIKLKKGHSVALNDRVIYKNVNYTVNNVTSTGWVQLG